MPTTPDADPSRPRSGVRRPTPDATRTPVSTPRSRITGRGSVAITLLAVLLVLALIGVALRLAHRSHRADDRSVPHGGAAVSAGPSATTASEASGARAGTASTGASPGTSGSSPAAPTSVLPAGATRDARGYVHSNYPSSGRFAFSHDTIAPRHRTATVHTYIVEVETSLSKANPQLAPDTVAGEVASVLNDPRGWTGMRSGPAKGVGFQLVDDPRRAQFVIHLATAQTVNRMCPLDTINLWSCDAGTTVLLNADRWLYATPSYPDVEAYRAYQVNHEVGHFLGFGHQYTCGPRGMAPTMMQQSKGLHGCRANPWPTVA